ncbi:MAG: 4Fe-4S dicluster domain-containing protein [Bacillota bacterium]|nr:4Fe-4S dicluster domain-containing protein [Bacillota bacterium]
MSAVLLNKDKWPVFVGKLSGKVWVPKVEDGDAICFAPLSGGEAELPRFCNTRIPPKEIVFPETETLYRFKAGGYEIKAPQPDEKTVIVGIRPCDARAMKIVDSLFHWGVDDPYYLKRREMTTLVGLACSSPGPNCFCTSVGGGPASTEGLDVIMFDLNDYYLLEDITEKGKALLEEAEGLFEKAGDDALKQKDESISDAESKINRSVNVEGILEGLPGLWEDPLWKRVSASCLGCGTCTYLCPTCHCFDIQDETEGFEARRYRTWDSCMFEEYTRHASGHNPRPTRKERTRNRINHKYSYYVDKFDLIACVGCGRCINYCPVNIDIVDILRQVKEAL